MAHPLTGAARSGCRGWWSGRGARPRCAVLRGLRRGMRQGAGRWRRMRPTSRPPEALSQPPQSLRRCPRASSSETPPRATRASPEAVPAPWRCRRHAVGVGRGDCNPGVAAGNALGTFIIYSLDLRPRCLSSARELRWPMQTVRWPMQTGGTLPPRLATAVDVSDSAGCEYIKFRANIMRTLGDIMRSKHD